MPNAHWSDLSNNFMLGTVLLYVVAMVGYAADLAFGDRRRAAARSAAAAAATVTRERVLVGAAGGPADGEAGELEAEADEPEPSGRRVDWGRFAVLMNVIGWAAHLCEIVTRGLAADRLPWGNMYEFTSAFTFASVTVYLIVVSRQHWARILGTFVMIGAVVALGIATLLLYESPGALRPSLHSYWLGIHVTAAITATGVFTVAGVASILYVMKSRAERNGRELPPNGLYAKLPSADALDRLSHRTIMFGFPIWTFAIICGAVWADSAWGHYWQWDPKETWSFITWVVYAGYLHARATVGWRGRKAAIISLIGFACLLFNFFGINYLVSGMHSYAG
jgi:cytochrome c-type biogenesis protein CcsB